MVDLQVPVEQVNVFELVVNRRTARAAYYMFLASRTGDPTTISHVVRHVVIADWLFTTTTIIFQPLSGIYLAQLAQMPLTSAWILWSRVQFVAAPNRSVFSAETNSMECSRLELVIAVNNVRTSLPDALPYV